MENVSHNTSFDSNDDNLSRATNQQPFEDDQDAQLQQTHQEQSQSFERGFGPQHSRQPSATETERNPYGFDPNAASNPSHQMQQAIWQDFQRAQQASTSDNHNQGDPPLFDPHSHNQQYANNAGLDEQYSDQVSRPTAVFGGGNQGATNLSHMQFEDFDNSEDNPALMEQRKVQNSGSPADEHFQPSDNQDMIKFNNALEANDKSAQTFSYEPHRAQKLESEGVVRSQQIAAMGSYPQSESRKLKSGASELESQNRNQQQLHFQQPPTDAQQVLDNDKVWSHLESQYDQQQQQFNYREEFARRYYPDQQLEVRINNKDNQHQEAQAKDHQKHDVDVDQTSQPVKKRSRADFLSKTSFQSNNNQNEQSQVQSAMHSHQSSASKESIMQSLRKQQSKHAAHQKASQNYNSLVEHHESNSQIQQQIHMQQQVIVNAPIQERLDRQYEEEDDAQQHQTRGSFPNSEQENDHDAGAGDQHKSRGCMLICMLQSKILGRRKEESLRKRMAFDKLFLNRQTSFMDQLLNDNEHLMDQIQDLQNSHKQQPTQNTYSSQSVQNLPSQKAVPEKSAQELYGDGQVAAILNSRNNEKSDQTRHGGNLESYHSNKLHPQHTNSSNKEVSPNRGLNQRENAFMRAMLRDETPRQQINSLQQSPYNAPNAAGDDGEINAANLAQDSFFDQFSRQLKEFGTTMMQQQSKSRTASSNTISVELRVKLDELCRTFDSQADRLKAMCQQLDQTNDLLSTKVQGVDRLELENLELHMQLDAKLRALETLLRCGTDASKLFKFDNKKSCESQVQTDTVYSEVVNKEATLQIFSKELSVVKLRQEEDFSLKMRELEKRDSDLEIRERLIEEKRIEYSYKQKELNQRIKGQMTWPLNCLENDTKLLEKFKDFKLKPDHLKALEADSNLSLFLQRQENIDLMQGLQGDMLAKCEGLLHFEYVLLKERAKNIVFHENAISELTTLQNESDELSKDRERYQISSDLERQLQQESQRIDKSRIEIVQTQESFFKLISTLSEAFHNLSHTPQHAYNQQSASLAVSPQPKSSQTTVPQNQLNLLLGNLSRTSNYQSDHKQHMVNSKNNLHQNYGSSRISPAINPYSQTINAKDPATLLQVVNDYRATDPMLNKLQSKDMQTLIETTLDHLQTSSNIVAGSQGNNQIRDGAEGRCGCTEGQNLRSIRRMLIRDAYFLQKERQWLDQERLKLNSALSRKTRKRSQDIRTAQVQTSLERNRPSQTGRAEQAFDELPNQQHQPMFQPTHQRLHTDNSFNLLNHTNDFSPHQRQQKIQHGPRESMDSSVRQTNNQSVTSAVDNLSMLSTLEQDRKKIQLLQTNLTLEKDYNRDLNTQLTAQMELIKMQNEKLIEGESHINEMKLRLLIKFEQIKVLEDFYNKYHSAQNDEQIHLEIDLDDDQLRQIVIQLYQKHQKDSNADLNWHLGQPVQANVNKDDCQTDSFNNNMSHSNSNKLLSAMIPARKVYNENWALTGIQSILRHLLMDKCKFNPSQHRLQYAFLLFKCAILSTSARNGDEKKDLNETQQLNELLRQSTPLGSQLDESQPAMAIHDLTNNSIVVADDRQITAQVKEMDDKCVGTETPIDCAENKASETMASRDDKDWFELYWARKRLSDYSDLDDQSPRQLQAIAARLEDDIASFWKFKARNTLRLMQVHMGRRKRMVHAFAFQKLKVQTMRATIQRVINLKVQTHTGVQMLNGSPGSKRSEDRQQNEVQAVYQRKPQQTPVEMTIAKRHAIMLMLTQRNEKLQNMKDKNRHFRRWKESVQDAQAFTMQIEVARLAKEIETVKFHEEMMRANFTVQKTELESKVTVLLGLIAS